MTKLYNRRFFAETSEGFLELAKRNKTNSCVVMIDIDRFKSVNDLYGHKIGDRVIISLANILQKQTRASDIVSRWGGEEFVIFLANTNSIGATVIAEKIRKIVENSELTVKGNKKLRYTVSAGISQVNNKEDLNIEASIDRADTALYEAKDSGRNRVCVKL